MKYRPRPAVRGIRLSFLLLVLAIVLLPPAAVAAVPDGIVYVRVPRSTTPIHIPEDAGYQYKVFHYEDKPGGGYTTTWSFKPIFGDMDPSFLDTLPEVHYIKGSFNAPGQLVWRHDDGTQDIIYDCANNNPDHPGPPAIGKDTCVPMDPAVSYDGEKLAFAVYHGTYYRNRQFGIPPGSGEVGKLVYWYGTHASWAGIYVYDFTTKELTAWPHQNHVWDTAPVWLPDGKIMFSSTRASATGSKVWQPYVLGRTDQPQQLWIADVDANGTNPRNFRNVDPHDQQNALHPFVHSSGRVFYSSHQINKVRTEETHQTPSNLWWLMSTDLRGGDLNAHLHAHYFKWGDVTLTALHFLGERSNGDLCSDMYYRRNNFGAGRIVCWPALAAHDDPGDERSPLGHEGPYPFKTTTGYYSAIAGGSGDAGAQLVRDSENRIQYAADGFPEMIPEQHMRDPAGLPGNQLLFAGAFGSDNECHFSGVPTMLVYSFRGFSCDMGIYETTDSSDAPHDKISGALTHFRKIVDSPDWHEFMARPVVPYSAIYGMAKPAQPPLSNTDDNNPAYGIFAAVNAFKGDLKAYPLIATNSDGTPAANSDYWAGPSKAAWCAQQGCAMQALVRRPGGYPNGNLQGIIKGLRFWEAVPNTHRYSNTEYPDGTNNKMYDIWGQKLRLLGDVLLKADGSFKVKLPVDTPFLMAGIDEKGRVIARHQQIMSLRPGEKQVCAGCHLHGTTDSENAQHPFAGTEAGQIADRDAPVLELPQGYPREMPEFTAKIYPMLKKNCGACHGGAQGNHVPILTASPQQVYYTLLHNMSSDYMYKYADGTVHNDIAKVPWMTRYVNVFFARESLLYWKAAGMRTDGRDNNTRNDDFDFGPAHASHLTAPELARLANWIDTGAYRDQHADVDIIFRNGFEP